MEDRDHIENSRHSKMDLEEYAWEVVREWLDRNDSDLTIEKWYELIEKTIRYSEI
jgi:hypothetical protein